MKLLIAMTTLIISLNASAKDTLTIGVFKILPYGNLEDGKVVGIIPDIASRLEKLSGITIKKKLLPYKRMIESLDSGSIDFAIFFLSDRSQQVSDRIIPLYDLDTIAVGLKGSSILKYEDLYNYQIATPRGVHYSSRFSKDDKMKINYVLDYNYALKMLVSKRVGVVIAPEKIFMFQLKKLGYNDSILDRPYILTTNTAWLQFSKKSKKKALINKLIKAAKILKENKEIIQIIDKNYQL